MNRMILAMVLGLGAAAGVALAQDATTQVAPVRAEPASAMTGQQQEVAALRQQVADLQRQVQQLKTQPQASPTYPAPPPMPVREVPMVTPAPAPQAAAPVVVPAPLTAIAPPLVEPVRRQLPPGTWVRVARVSVTDTKVDGDPGLHVVSYVTIHGLPNVQFTYQAVLVMPDGKIHTDVRGKPYEATRGVQTGDFDDTDDYAADISLKDLFSSSPPADLAVQVRILDVAGGIVAESGLENFRRP